MRWIVNDGLLASKKGSFVIAVHIFAIFSWLNIPEKLFESL